jgi:ATP-binding cassette subfamily B (MDR/TAP) protein 1
MDAGAIVGEVVTSVRTIASFTLEKRRSDRFVTTTETFLDNNVGSGSLIGVYQTYLQFSLFAAFALLYWFGGNQIGEGKTDFEVMLIPIFCMFILGVDLGQEVNAPPSDLPMLERRLMLLIVFLKELIANPRSTTHRKREL